MISQNPYAVDMTRLGVKKPGQSISNVKGPPPTNPYAFTGTDSNGTFMGGGEMGGEQQVRTQMAPPQQQLPQSPNPLSALFPTFNKSDFQKTYRPFMGSDADGRWTDIGGTDVWGITPEAAQRYWKAGDRQISQGLSTDLSTGRATASGWADTNYWPEFDEQGNFKGMTIKTADKGGTYVPYSAGEGGSYNPLFDQMQMRGWDTNDSEANIAALMAVAGLFAPVASWAAAGGGAGGAAGGASATGGAGSATSPWVSQGGLNVLGSEVAAGYGAGGATGAAAATEAAGGLVGLGGTASLTPAQASALSSLPWSKATPEAVSAITKGASGGSSWLDTLKKGAGGLDKVLGGGGGAAGGGGRTGGGGMGGGLLPLLAALYGKEAQGRYADDLKGIATGMRADAEPFLGKLKESYENPNAYFESPDVKARLELETNRLMGLDSSRGKLSNPIERDMLLQKYAAKDMDQYRDTLRSNLSSMYNPQATANMFGQASAAERARYGDLAALAGMMSMGGGGFGGMVDGVGNTIDGIGDIIDAGGDLWDWVSDWWS